MRLKNRMSILFLTTILISIILSGCTDKSSDTSAAISNPTTSKVSKTTPTVESENIELVIAAAASLTDVAAEIADMYNSVAPNIKITYNFGSSGALQTQIEEGAPIDVFMSAAKKQMTALEEKGLTKEGTKKELLINKVVLIIPKGSTKKITGFEDAATKEISTIALGEPSSVPVGQYSEEIFTTLSILDKVKVKANYGSDVRQVLTWVESGEVDCGVVYATDAVTSQKITVVSEAPKDSHKPVIYPVAVLKSSKHAMESQAFLDFLSTPEVAKLFKKYGFEMK